MRSLILASLLSSFAISAEIGGIAIVVKNSPITMYEIEQESKISGENVNKSADALIRKKLESLEAKERKISVSNAEIDSEIEAMATQNNLSVEQYKNVMKEARGTDDKLLREHISESIKSQKLYSSIAFSKMSEPNDDEIQEYYELHIDEFSKAESFDVSIYQSNSFNLLVEQTTNEMNHFENIFISEDRIDASLLNPELLYLLNKTPEHSFSQILPHPQGGYITFYIKNKNGVITESLSTIKPYVKNAILNEKRNQVLNDYFTRLRLEADIKILRLPTL